MKEELNFDTKTNTTQPNPSNDNSKKPVRKKRQGVTVSYEDGMRAYLDSYELK